MIETARLILRPYVDGDAERVLDIHSRLDVIGWLGDPPYVPMASVDEALAWIARWSETAKGGPYDVGLAIEVRETGAVAGTVMVVPLPNAEHGERQVGWHLHPDAAGHGYATEAARALLDHVFTAGLDEIWCDMFPDNAPSAAVAERLGLRDLGIVPDRWYGGDSRMFHSRREDWLPVIETERLTLRLFTAEDADFVFDLFRRPEVARWSSQGVPMEHRDEAVARIARQPERAGEHPAAGIFAAVPHGSDAPVGMVVLVPIPTSEGFEGDDMEVGWHFHPDAWGNGYATEGARAVVDRAFASGIPHLHAVTDPLNAPSQAVCRRLGMTDLGLRSDWYDRELRAFRLDRP